ncbi:heterokaryon incompatibility protein-domain-containing protein [Xylaria castorea]|nr:heterokaryon incompatibility protein-domain-containing protein [Xylaria castorea]
MDDLPVDNTWQDLLEDAFLDNNTLRTLAAAAIRNSGRPICEQTSVPDNFNSISDGGKASADHGLDSWERNVPQASQTTTSALADAYVDEPVDVSWDEPDERTDLFSNSGNHNLQQPSQATTGATRDANDSTPTARFADEAGMPDDLFSSGNGSLPRLRRATIRATGDASEGPRVAEAGVRVHEPADPDPNFETHNPPQPSQPSQATTGATGNSSTTGSSSERAIDGSNPFHNDTVVSRKSSKRQRGESSSGLGHPRPSKRVRGADQTSTKRQFAARPLPVFGGYRVPVATTVGDTETIEWVSSNAAGTPLSSIAPQALTMTTRAGITSPAQTSVSPTTGQAMTAGGAGTDLTPTPSSSTTGQTTTSGGAMADLGQTLVSSTLGQVGTAALGQSEELEESPLRMVAVQAEAQPKSRIADQASESAKFMRDWQHRAWIELNKPDGVLQECRGKVDAMFSNFDRRSSRRQFRAPNNECGRQMNHIISLSSMHMSATKGQSTLFVEDHSKDPIATPSVDRKAHLEEFKFRLKLCAELEPLETIRLLRPVWSPALLEKWDIIDTDEIPKYDLRDFPCEDRPKYMALSYVWGEETPMRAISINGTVVQVRKNLAQALQSITHFDPHMYVFADAICINQQDDREKSIMVQHMAQIFSDAWLVYAWLGPVQDSSTEDLLTHFSDLGKLFWQHVGPTELNKLSERSLDIDTILTRNIGHLFGRFKHPPGKQGAFPTEEYSSFSARPFWSRIWVLQEVYLAKRLYYACGSCYLASNYLAGALILLEAFQRHLIRTQASILESPVLARDETSELLREFALGFPSFPGMHRLIVYTSIYPMDVVSLRIAMTNFCVKELPSGSKATDPRDMIYGLLGFCNEEERSYIRADYSKSVQLTYTAVTRAMIRNGFTDIMSWAQTDAKRIVHLPSWVPDYSSTIYESLCSQGQAKPWLPHFRACNEAKYSHDETTQLLDPLAIPVHGRRLDRVMRVGRRWFPRSRAGSGPLFTGNAGALLARSISYKDLHFFLEQVREFVHLAGRIYNRLVEDEYIRPIGQGGRGKRPPFSNAGIWRVPCCDQIVINGRLVRRDPSTESRYNMIIEYLFAEAYKQEPEMSELPAESRPYLESLVRWADKRPFLTEQGFVGLGPANMAPRDTLAVLDGFNACYLVRLQSLLGSDYRLVGEAYVDGIMDGEMIGSIPDPCVWFHLV